MFSKKFASGKARSALVQDIDHTEPITMESVMKFQQHKFNPHEPLFLSVKQYEELCKTTYDGSVPFTFTAVVGDERKDDQNSSSEGVEESKDDIVVTEVSNTIEKEEEQPYVPKKKKTSRK